MSDSNGRDITNMRVPLTLTMGIWGGVIVGSLAVGGFIWQSVDTRSQLLDSQVRQETRQQQMIDKLTSIDNTLGRMDERVKAVERRGGQ